MAYQDVGKFRENQKDQFYTKDEKAKLCIETLLASYPFLRNWRWIEPSAGKGSFLHCLPAEIQTLALDIDPKAPGIQQQDFLAWNPPPSPLSTIVFGNPPFGRQSKLARSFIQHASEFADMIAFILPRSFMKPSMTKVFPLHFHCVHTLALSPNSFEVNGEDYSVPCIFQIWQKKNTPRVLQQFPEPFGFHYTKSTDPHDLVIRRVGVYAGRCYIDNAQYSPQSHYYIELDAEYKHKKAEIQAKMNQYNFPNNTTGPRSISKGEIHLALNPILQS